MKRALFSQIKKDWKENFWLIIELMVVAIIIWGLSLNLLREYKNSRIPLGADITDVYAAEVSLVDIDNNPFYHSGDNMPEVPERYQTDLVAMLERIRHLPMVEAVALGNNVIPYNYSYIGNMLAYRRHNADTKHDIDTVPLHVNQRSMTPDGVKVLRLQSLSGSSPRQLQKVLEDGNLLFGESEGIRMFGPRLGIYAKDIIGADLVESYEGYKVGDIINDIRRSDYEVQLNSATVIVPFFESSPQALEYGNTLIVRVKPGQGREFEKAMEKEPTLIAPTTVALSQLRSMQEDRQVALYRSNVQQRTYVAGIIFLLAIIFIGLLGTFWYRVYLRTPEIAVRKTFGATDADILRRFLSEAFILLVIALLLGVVICIVCMDYLKTGLFAHVVQFSTWKWDMALAGLITATIMSLMILVGVGIPAFRAMRIEPAIALKEE